MTRPFRLAVVVRLRELAEEAARAGLATAVDAHRRALESLAAAQATLDAEGSAAAALAGRPVPVGALAEAAAAVEHAERATRAEADRAALAARDLMTAREALGVATRRREVVERLRDRAEAARRRDEERREQERLDAIGVLAGAARVRGEPTTDRP